MTRPSRNTRKAGVFLNGRLRGGHDDQNFRDAGVIKFEDDADERERQLSDQPWTKSGRRTFLNPERRVIFGGLDSGPQRGARTTRAASGGSHDDRLEGSDRCAFEQRQNIKLGQKGEIADAVEAALVLLDTGQARVAEKKGDEWVVHDWLKKAVLLSFRLNDNRIMGPALGVPVTGPTSPGPWWDKVPTKFSGWTPDTFRAAGFRVVPGTVVRHSAYIAPGVILMPSFVNVGAYVAEGTMIDTWATVGSCAQIGKNCHISGGAGIGGVLEPLQANPVIIEDNCFIGARAEVAEGVIVGEGSVLSMGVYLGQSTKDRRSRDRRSGLRPRSTLFGCRIGDPTRKAISQ